MSQKDQIESLEDRTSLLEAKLSVMEDQDLPNRVSRMEMAYLYAKAALVIVPMIASVLVFMDWFNDNGNMSPPPVVDVVCEECLLDPLAGEWYCYDCVIVEDVNGQAVCFNVPDVAESRDSVHRAGQARLPGLRYETHHLQVTY